MALKFLNKKGWHTGSLRNLENVWKAEQKHEAEQKKLEELKAQIHKEREAEELRQQYQAAGLVPKQDRLEFLYDSGAGPSGAKPVDDYSSQRAAAEARTDSSKPAKPGEKLAAQTPGALFSAENNNISANDKWRKIHSDPLYLIKQQELAALERIRKNPVKMEMLANEVRQKIKSCKDDDDDDGKHKKKKKKDKSSKKRDRDHKHVKEDKKISKTDKHRKPRDRDDSSVSGSSDSETETRPSKVIGIDDRFGRKTERETAPANGNDIDNRSSGRSHRDFSPSGNEDEDRRDRGGSLLERSVRESHAEDRLRENISRNARSEQYNRDDRRSRRDESHTRSGDYDRNYRSSRDYGRDDRGRVSPDHDAMRFRYNGNASRSRDGERDDRDPKDYVRERDSRDHKKYEGDDRRRRMRD
ncbi:hypothetical protein R1flu_002704 [Riccia fluitans]|uniref:CBF1-interacting co-repressor CIR N-terminal domain-containing protein n=1 Tax=Riccia fluitans TaxID=41844 RepID=A0ABD1Y6W5_9MARC